MTVRYQCAECGRIHIGDFEPCECGSWRHIPLYSCEGCGELHKADDLLAMHYCRKCLDNFMADPENLKAYAMDGLYYFSDFMFDRERKKKQA